MPSLRPIRQKITSVQSTRKITSAMKMVSAAKLRRAQEIAENTRPYATKIKALMSNLSQGSVKDDSDFFKSRDVVNKITAIVITSDRGLCGGFNMNVIKRFLAFKAENADKDISLVLIGKRANDYFASRNANIIKSLFGFQGGFHFDEAANIGEIISSRFISGEADAVYCFYNEFVSTSTQLPRGERLLPLSVAVSSSHSDASVHYEYEPDAEEILNALVPKFVNFSIYSRVLESLAGEHGARMMAMESATKNAKEMLERLNIKYNNLRQANITTELLDIVNGAEALN